MPLGAPVGSSGSPTTKLEQRGRGRRLTRAPGSGRMGSPGGGYVRRGLLALAAFSLFGQSVEGPQFEVASLKKLKGFPSDIQNLTGGPGMSTPTGGTNCDPVFANYFRWPSTELGANSRTSKSSRVIGTSSPRNFGGRHRGRISGHAAQSPGRAFSSALSSRDPRNQELRDSRRARPASKCTMRRTTRNLSRSNSRPQWKEAMWCFLRA